MGVLCVGHAAPVVVPINPDCAKYTRSLLSSISSILLPSRSTSLCFKSSALTKLPPSVLNCSLSTSVSTSMRLALVSAAVCAPPTCGKFVTALPAGAGVAATGAVFVAEVVCGGCGKKVGTLPWLICHWSHSMTKEKPKTTQRIVRRMSFMVFETQKKKRKKCAGGTTQQVSTALAQAAQGRGRHGTTGDNVRFA